MNRYKFAAPKVERPKPKKKRLKTKRANLSRIEDHVPFSIQQDGHLRFNHYLGNLLYRQLEESLDIMEDLIGVAILSADGRDVRNIQEFVQESRNVLAEAGTMSIEPVHYNRGRY